MKVNILANTLIYILVQTIISFEYKSFLRELTHMHIKNNLIKPRIININMNK